MCTAVLGRTELVRRVVVTLRRHTVVLIFKFEAIYRGPIDGLRIKWMRKIDNSSIRKVSSRRFLTGSKQNQNNNAGKTNKTFHLYSSSSKTISPPATADGSDFTPRRRLSAKPRPTQDKAWI